MLLPPRSPSLSSASAFGAAARDPKRRLTETLERQAATAEILRIIASSRTDVLPTFEAIASAASRLWGARDSGVIRFKFTPAGGRIDVRAALVDGMAEVAVTDTGVGIAPEDQEAIFEEFRRVRTADKKVEGTGLVPDPLPQVRRAVTYTNVLGRGRAPVPRRADQQMTVGKSDSRYCGCRRRGTSKVVCHATQPLLRTCLIEPDDSSLLLDAAMPAGRRRLDVLRACGFRKL